MVRTMIEAKYHAFLLKRNKRFMLLYTFALLLTYPLLMVFGHSISDIYGLRTIGLILNILIAIAASIFIPLLMFHYTTSKKSLDVYDSLPLRKESMFRIHYLAGITMMLLPLLVSILVGYVYIHISPEAQALLLTSSYYTQATLSLDLLHFLEVAVGLIVSYSITTFVKQNCGTTVDAIIYTAVVHLIPLLTYSAFYLYLDATLLGFNERFSDNIILNLTPFPIMFNFFNDYNAGIVNVPRFVYFIVVALVLFFASSYLYVTHRSERSESPFMNTLFYPIVSATITVIAMIILHSAMQYSFDTLSQIVYPILLACIFYLVLDVIANRGFSKIFQAVVRFGGLVVITAALILPIKVTRGFGFVTRTPDLDTIEYVEVFFPYNISELIQVNGLNVRETEEIQQILDFHDLIITEYDQYDYSDNTMAASTDYTNTYPFAIGDELRYIEFIYHLEDGDVIKRYYRIPLSWTHSLLDFTDSQAATDARLEIFDQEKIKEVGPTEMYLGNEEIKKEIDPMTVYELLKEDMENISQEEYLGGLYASLGQFEMNARQDGFYLYSASIDIDSSYLKTAEYLLEHGAVPVYESRKLEEVTKIRLVYPNNENNLVGHYSLRHNYPMFNETLKDSGFKYKELDLATAYALTPYMHSTAYFEEPGYLVEMYTTDEYDYHHSEYFLISPEASEILEEATSDIPFASNLYYYQDWDDYYYGSMEVKSY